MLEKFKYYAIIMNMKKYLYLIFNFITIGYSFWYASLGGFVGNKGALSKIGLIHHGLFIVWGALTYLSLAIGIHIGYSKTKFKFYRYLLLVSLVGMVLTLAFRFDYSLQLDYWLHCIGSLGFSVITGINVFLLFLLTKKEAFTMITGGILFADLVLLIIFKETAIIELFPIISGIIMLTINSFSKEESKIEVKR